MAEQLDLTAPETFPSISTWSVVDIYMSKEAPSLKVTLASNTGARFVYRVVPSATVTAAKILNALSFINQGKFMTTQGKSLQRWLLDKISAEGVKIGTISGTPD